MKMSHLVREELKQRKVRLATSLLVVVLATSVMVAVHSINRSSRRSVAQQMRNIGSNIFLVPRTLPMTDYYRADFGAHAMLESVFYKLTGSRLIEPGETVKAQLCARMEIDGHTAILTGSASSADNQSRSGPSELTLGFALARDLGKRPGDLVTIADRPLPVQRVLPEKGTADDIRITTDLQTAQQLLERGRVINLIEIVSERTEVLSEQIALLLPEARVVTKQTLAQAQRKTLQSVSRYSTGLLIVVFVAGLANIANYMTLNVRERRQEIGTLLALGATPRLIVSLFLKKAFWLGIAGGVGGYLGGTLLALELGPWMVHTQVGLAPEGFFLAVATAVIFAVAASCGAARKAAALDPAVILQQE